MPTTVIAGGYQFDRAAYGQSEASRLLGGVTRQHLANMEKAGKLRTVRLGRRVLIPATEIARLLGELDVAPETGAS